MPRFSKSWFSKQSRSHQREESAEKPVEPAGDAPPRTLSQRLLREWLIPIGLVMAVMAPIRSVVADWNDVPTGSMRPTILEGDRIYVNKLAFGLRVPFLHSWICRWGTPCRGDIVTFASPADGTRLVKRIVGVPGDRLELRHNVLHVNGVASDIRITDPEASATLPNGVQIPVVIARENLSGVDHAVCITPAFSTLKSSFSEIVIPPGQYFVMGDNRDQSNDSRYIGLIPEDTIYGRCPGVALSLDPEHNYSPRWDRFFSGLE